MTFEERSHKALGVTSSIPKGGEVLFPEKRDNRNRLGPQLLQETTLGLSGPSAGACSAEPSAGASAEFFNRAQ